MSKYIFTFVMCMYFVHARANDSLRRNDSAVIRVLFLYGSTPKKEFKSTESKSFGGKLGGHVGISSDSGRVVSFLPYGKFHKVSKKKKIHSRFLLTSEKSFWQMLGNKSNDVKKAIVHIPVSNLQKIQLDSIHQSYLKRSPYDYAFIGMRCGSATYDILSQIGVLPQYSNKKTGAKIFYPKKLRKRLFKLAKKNKWKVEKRRGKVERDWEKK